MQDHENFSPEILEGLSTLNVICLDDIQAISGNTVWEVALFDFFNEAKHNQTRLVFSGDCSPQELTITLRDLRSRLQSIPVFRLTSMTDKQSIDALIFRAQQRGMELNDATAEFIYRRSNRSIDHHIRATAPKAAQWVQIPTQFASGREYARILQHLLQPCTFPEPFGPNQELKNVRH